MSLKKTSSCWMISWYFLIGCVLCKSYVIRCGSWQFRGHPIAYEHAKVKVPSATVMGGPNITAEEDLVTIKSETTLGLSSSQQIFDKWNNEVPILILNGFGVGSFHQHRLVHEVLETDASVSGQFAREMHQIYSIDYLGQGKSWPVDCQDGESLSEKGLRYCGQTWVDQIEAFIEQVIKPCHLNKKVHVVGNSLGGHLAVFLAAKRPDLIESLVLLNATPVWGLNLPAWNGRLPAPWLPKIIGRYLFDQIRDLKTIEHYLRAAYYNEEAYDKQLIQQIRDCTDGKGGHAAFASILWSPPITIGKGKKFYDALSTIECDVLMLFGRDDPWCKPAFAKRMLEKLPSHIAARYVQCTQVGHCPNHEAPVATAHVIQRWLQLSHEDRQAKAPLFNTDQIQERWGLTELEELMSHEIPVGFVDRLAITFV